LKQGRQCLILTQWKEHCRLPADRLAQKGKNPFVLSGGIGKKERSLILETIADTSPEKELLVIATGQYLGEGFDCPRIDTLFLAFPMSFKGKIVQYVGRTLRTHQGKKSVLVYDYFDAKVPVLSRMTCGVLRPTECLDSRWKRSLGNSGGPASTHRFHPNSAVKPSPRWRRWYYAVAFILARLGIADCKCQIADLKSAEIKIESRTPPEI
jgi:Helicase conserved C-terminal domain